VVRIAIRVCFLTLNRLSEDLYPRRSVCSTQMSLFATKPWRRSSRTPVTVPRRHSGADQFGGAGNRRHYRRGTVFVTSIAASVKRRSSGCDQLRAGVPWLRLCRPLFTANSRPISRPCSATRVYAVGRGFMVEIRCNRGRQRRSQRTPGTKLITTADRRNDAAMPVNENSPAPIMAPIPAPPTGSAPECGEGTRDRRP